MSEQSVALELAVQYAQYIDNREFEKLRDIMAVDFQQQGPGFSCSSIDEFIAGLAILDNYSATLHLLGQQSGSWDGDSYRGETYCVANHLYAKDGVERKMDMGIRYADRIDLIDGRYKYTRRDLNIVWTQDLPLQG